LAGAAKDTIACVLPGVADTEVGASGTVAGVTGEDAKESAELPTLFVATTVKVYGVPFVRPVIVIGEDPDAVRPPGLDLAV
jgi:hypothetical protein